MKVMYGKIVVQLCSSFCNHRRLSVQGLNLDIICYRKVPKKLAASFVENEVQVVVCRQSLEAQCAGDLI